VVAAQVIAGRRAPYSHAGRMRMRMRGLPEIGGPGARASPGRRAAELLESRCEIGDFHAAAVPVEKPGLRIGVCAM